MNRVAVLGSSGMLGSMVLKHLESLHLYDVKGLTRSNISLDDLRFVEEYDWIINCIGVIKPMIDEGDADSVANAYRVNSWFPRELAYTAEWFDKRVIQIATDCVWTGTTLAEYYEGDPHDAEDIYGRSKSMGEIESDAVRNIRCSIIGPEGPGRSRSLLEWLKSCSGNQPDVTGYSNHLWNGVTTLAFAKVCHALMQDVEMFEECPREHALHLHPLDNCSKYDLLKWMNDAYDLDLNVKKWAPEVSCNRTIGTIHDDLVNDIWTKAYGSAPTIKEMIEEMARAE